MIDLPRLNRALATAPGFRGPGGEAFDASLLDLPERVLWFSAGRFLRGFAGPIIDAANRAGEFAGRCVVVQSSGQTVTDQINRQDGLYTLCVQGVEDGAVTSRSTLISSVSRALSAERDWPALLEVARSPDLALVLSNTTELGLSLSDADGRADRRGEGPPRSFPARLAEVLHERFCAFDGDRSRGLVVVPCELMHRNGETLHELVAEASRRAGFPSGFRSWLAAANVFCNSLCDRTVTGDPPRDEIVTRWHAMGFRDALLQMVEPYKLWAIEAAGVPREKLGWAHGDPAVVITDDVRPFAERKLRLMNGVHTMVVPVAFLAGVETVIEAMGDPAISRFTEGLLINEIVPSLDVESGPAFAYDTLERFRNPFLRHRLSDIVWQTTPKMHIRVMPSVRRYAERFDRTPERLCFAFACCLLYLRGREHPDGLVHGERRGVPYPIMDDHALAFSRLWSACNTEEPDDVRRFVHWVCSLAAVWGSDLNEIDGFAEAVADHLLAALAHGVRGALDRLLRRVEGEMPP